jgi:hypothetical protein
MAEIVRSTAGSLHRWPLCRLPTSWEAGKDWYKVVGPLLRMGAGSHAHQKPFSAIIPGAYGNLLRSNQEACRGEALHRQCTIRLRPYARAGCMSALFQALAECANMKVETTQISRMQMFMLTLQLLIESAKAAATIAAITAVVADVSQLPAAPPYR